MELREWQYINKPAGSTTNNSSSGYKKRFEKLIKYHIDHASSELESITRKDISDRYFRLSEHYNDGSKEFDRDIIVAVDMSTEEFEIHIFIDHKEVESIQRKGYTDFVAAIEPYMFLPDNGTPEYTKLLTESYSIADDFKAYENLWEDVDAEEYNMVLGRTSYNLYDDSDLESYLTQSARLMRKPVGNNKPLEYFKLRKVDMMLRTPRFRDNKKLAGRLQKVKSELEKSFD